MVRSTAILLAIGTLAVSAQPRTFSIAFYNIRSGKGIQPLNRIYKAPSPFAESDSCDTSRPPVNAWGAGVVQKALTTMAGEHPDLVALGLAEAWFCGSPEHVRQTLGWKEHSGERNGTGLVARYGFAKRPEWVELDTSQNKNPKDTMWAVFAPVCTASRCADTVDVYIAHWSGTGEHARETFDRQAQQTVAFMEKSRGAHVLLGDLNVFEGSSPVCRQEPLNSPLETVRAAGYVDVWRALHPNEPGHTGMLNRAGCGTPEGAPWKRIDYAWAKRLEPDAMALFGTVAPGAPAPSDHVGIVATFRSSRP